MERLNVNCLGRPFQIGMLYDRRSDSLIDGLSFWDYDQLHTKIRKCELRSTQFEVFAEDSLSERYHHLGVDASLELSILAGLVSVSSSGSYATDQKASKHTKRITLMYKTTTHHDQLSMDQLGNIDLKRYAFGARLRQMATHIVVGVTYGADAFMLFDKTVTEEENHEEIKGSMETAVNLIPEFAISGSADFELDDKQKDLVKTLNCKFYGDFLLEENPTTFSAAVKVYKSLPSLLGKDGENAVSKTAFLCPISYLIEIDGIIYQVIKSNLIDQALHLMLLINELDMEVITLNNDIEKYTHNLPYLVADMFDLTQDINKQKFEFYRKLSDAILKARSSNEKNAEQELSQLLSKPPIDINQLRSQLDEKGSEVLVLKDIFGLLAASPNIAYTYTQADFNAFVLNFEYEHVYCLKIQHKKTGSVHKKETSDDSSASDSVISTAPGPWYTQFETIKCLRERAQRFAWSALASENDARVRFIVSTSSAIDSKAKYDTMEFNGIDYENGTGTPVTNIPVKGPAMVFIPNGEDVVLDDSSSYTEIPLADYNIPSNASAVELNIKVEPFTNKGGSTTKPVDDAMIVYPQYGSYEKFLFFGNAAKGSKFASSNSDSIVVPVNGEKALLMTKSLSAPLFGKATARVTGYYSKEYATYSITDKYYRMDKQSLTIELPSSVPQNASHIELYVEVTHAYQTASKISNLAVVAHVIPDKSQKWEKAVVTEKEVFLFLQNEHTKPGGCNSSYFLLPVTKERKVYFKIHALEDNLSRSKSDLKSTDSFKIKANIRVTGYRSNFPLTKGLPDGQSTTAQFTARSTSTLGETMTMPDVLLPNSIIELYVMARVGGMTTFSENQVAEIALDIAVHTQLGTQKYKKELNISGLLEGHGYLFNSEYMYLPVTNEMKVYVTCSYTCAVPAGSAKKDKTEMKMFATVQVTGYFMNHI